MQHHDYFPHRIPVSKPTFIPGSPGIATISNSSTFGPEILGSTSLSVGIRSPFIWDLSWENPFPTDEDLSLRMHDTRAKLSEQHELPVGGTISSGFEYRAELAGIGSIEFGAMRDVSDSYDYGVGVIQPRDF
jgi:hypothetical protein